MLEFTGERIVPGAENCEPNFAKKMYMEHSARYRFAAQLARGCNVLDIGCGVGYGSALLSDIGAKNVTAFDLSTDAIEYARINFSRNNISFSVKNAEDFSFNRKFDLITCFELIEHVNNPEAVLDRVAECIAPSGALVISTPRAKQKKRNEFHVKEFEYAEFAEFLRRRFSFVRLHLQNNRFSSQITDGEPEAFQLITYDDASFDPDESDYFVAVASNEPIDGLSLLDVATFSNDRYVTLLEDDVAILQKRRIELDGDVEVLRKIEDLSRAEIASLSGQKDAATAQALDLRTQVAQLEESIRALDKERRKLLAKLENPIKRTLKRWARSYRKRRERWFGKPESAGMKLVSSPPATIVEATTSMERLSVDILWVIGAPEGDSKRYRVMNLAESFRWRGYTTEAILCSGIDDLIKGRARPKVIVLFRADLNRHIRDLLNYAEENCIPVFYDVDDLVFEPSIIDEIRGYHLLSDSEKELYVRGVHSYRECLSACGKALLSTEVLRQAAARIVSQTHMVPNTVNRFQLDLAEVLVATPKTQTRRISYFSGSRTHNVDFLEASGALLRILAERSDVTLVICGHLDLDPAFDDYADQIERLDFMDYREMLRVLRECDINIAPLELDNRFNEAKSTLKWFEAALVETPTVASPTTPYREAISDGETGLLAETDDAWYAALTSLLDDIREQRRIGVAARKDVLRNWGPQALERHLAPLFEIVGPPSKAAARADRLRIDWIVPGLLIGGGGHRNILRAAYFLEQSGHDVGLIFTNMSETPEQIRALLHEHFYPFEGRIRLFDGIFLPSDVIMATHWSTVYPALDARGSTSEVVYFVQDLEPMFAPMGTEYIKAENTYRKGLYAICSGPWCATILKRDYGMQADFFEFPLDRDIYYPRPRTKKNLNILFFAKPEMPRRCYELGIEMLAELKRLCPQVEIICYGSKNVDVKSLPFAATALGMVPTLQDLAQAYSNADLGVVFSTTNPSLVPYEFMACGTPVVDLGRPGSEINYGGRHDIALLGDPDPKIMAREVAALLRKQPECAARSRAGIELVSKMPDERGVAQRIESLLMTRLRGADIRSHVDCNASVL